MRAGEAPRCEGPRWSGRVPVRSGRLVCGVLSRARWTEARGRPSAISREEVCGDDAYRRAIDETLISISCGTVSRSSSERRAARPCAFVLESEAPAVDAKRSPRDASPGDIGLD